MNEVVDVLPVPPCLPGGGGAAPVDLVVGVLVDDPGLLLDCFEGAAVDPKRRNSDSEGPGDSGCVTWLSSRQ